MPSRPVRLHSDVVRDFKTKLATAGLAKNVRFPDHRHNCASYLAAAGVHQRVITELLGYSSIRVTKIPTAKSWL